MVSLMSDSRVMFLVWFIIAAITIAVILVFVEMRVKKKQKAKEKVTKIANPVEEVDLFLKKKDNVRNKLEFIGKTAKIYFKNRYGMPSGADYSNLIKEFEKGKGNESEIYFCKKMFEAYYSDAELTEEDVRALGALFAKLTNKKKTTDNISEASGFFNRFDELLIRGITFVSDKIGGYIYARKEDAERQGRVIMKGDYEMMKWVRRAILYGYDKIKIERLLNDGNRSKLEVNKFLRVYDKEINKSSVRGVPSIGIARGIVKKEKKRLEDMEVCSSG